MWSSDFAFGMLWFCANVFGCLCACVSTCFVNVSVCLCVWSCAIVCGCVILWVCRFERECVLMFVSGLRVDVCMGLRVRVFMCFFCEFVCWC